MGELFRLNDFRRSRPQEPARAVEEMCRIDQAIAAVRLLKPAQAIVAARNFGELFDEVMAAGVSRARLASEVAGWEEDSSASKRLDRYLLPRRDRRTASEAEAARERRVAKLARRPDRCGKYVGYKQVGEAVARAMEGRSGWERERVLVRLFRGTPVDKALNALVDERVAMAADPENCWEVLSGRMHDLAAWVAREAGLREHQRLCAGTRARFDLADATISPYGGHLFAHGPLNNNFEIWEEFPPVPSVPLFEERLAERVPVVLDLSAPGARGGTFGRIDARATISREVRLAIGPADALDQTSPLFEVRTRVDLEVDGRPAPLRRPWLFLPLAGLRDDGGDEVEVTIGGVARTGSIEFPPAAPDGRTWRDMLAWPTGEGVSGALQPEHSYAAWRLATPALCAEMLGAERTQAIRGAVYVGFEPTGRPTLTPEGCLGALVEQALLDEAGPRLDRALLEEARLMVARVRGYVDGRRRQALEMHDAAAARWSGTGEDA